jgi:hypothetical protein
MLKIYDVKTAQQTILKRIPPDETIVPSSVLDRIAEPSASASALKRPCGVFCGTCAPAAMPPCGTGPPNWMAFLQTPRFVSRTSSLLPLWNLTCPRAGSARAGRLSNPRVPSSPAIDLLVHQRLRRYTWADHSPARARWAVCPRRYGSPALVRFDVRYPGAGCRC